MLTAAFPLPAAVSTPTDENLTSAGADPPAYMTPPGFVSARRRVWRVGIGARIGRGDDPEWPRGGFSAGGYLEPLRMEGVRARAVVGLASLRCEGPALAHLHRRRAA